MLKSAPSPPHDGLAALFTAFSEVHTGRVRCDRRSHVCSAPDLMQAVMQQPARESTRNRSVVRTFSTLGHPDYCAFVVCRVVHSFGSYGVRVCVCNAMPKPLSKSCTVSKKHNLQSICYYGFVLPCTHTHTRARARALNNVTKSLNKKAFCNLPIVTALLAI